VKIISFALWGDNPMYVRGMFRNLELAKSIYPEWVPMVWMDWRPSIAAELYRAGAWVEMMPSHGGIQGMFWRMLPITWKCADAVIVRDADSRLNVREAAAVHAWLESDKGVHVMRDHPHHAQWPMLGGMIGFKNGAVPNMTTLMNDWSAKNVKLDDMRFLASVVWPMVQGNCLVHSSVPEPLGGDPFPNHPPSYSDYVGQVFDADDNKDMR